VALPFWFFSFKFSIMNLDELIIYTDGGARGNPGPAGIGIVFFDKKRKLLKKYAAFIGRATNNQAEYTALLAALSKAPQFSRGKIKCLLDSELVVKQLNGSYKVKDKKLLPLFNKVIEATHKFLAVSFHHISREKNKIADALVNLAIEKKKGQGRGEN